MMVDEIKYDVRNECIVISDQTQEICVQKAKLLKRLGKNQDADILFVHFDGGDSIEVITTGFERTPLSLSSLL